MNDFADTTRGIDVSADAPHNSPVGEAQMEELTPAMAEEFSLWMSMALDGLLDEDEMAMFQACLDRYPELAEEWAEWQQLAQVFAATPSAEAPSDFVEKFDLRLTKQTRRRKLWLGAAVGVASVLLWGSIIVGLVSLGAFVMFQQPDWLTDFVHTAAFAFVTVSHWLENALSVFGSVVATPQALSFGIGYALLAGVVLYFWTQFLRRSTRTAEVQAVG